ncbi:hypothetical protein HDE_00365 [Halotydeus destructor]|nr:hypothetical protein HDE_00365 [Halotydeus destructor]
MKSQLLTCWWLMAIVATISTSGRESLDKVLRHVIYKAAYDVLAHHSDDTLVNTAAENNQLSGSSLDFLSSMANDVLALESGDADIVLKPPQNRAHRPEPLPEEGFVFAIDKTGRARLMMVHSLLTSSPNPVYVHMVQVSSLMQNIRERVEFQQRFVIKLDKVASHSLKGSQRILIMHDSLSMKSISVQGKAHVSRLQPKKLQWMRSPLSLRDLKFDISDLVHRKMLAASGIYSLIETFPDIVEKNKPGRVLEHATFDSFVAIPALRTAALSVQKADEVFMDAVLANIFWSGDHMIKGNIFLRDIILRGGNLVSSINGVDFQNFVLRNKVQVLGSALQMPKLFFRNWLKLNGTANFVLDQLVFLSDHPKVINSALKMSGLSIVETSCDAFYQ